MTGKTEVKLGVEVAAKNLTVRFGEFTAVKNVSFEVGVGEIFGFLGANGAGKTTTIRVLCGLLLPSSGDAVVGGVSVLKDPMAVKSKVGYMSQRFTLYEDMTVEENLLFAASLRKLDDRFYKERVKKLFKMIGFDRSPKLLVSDLPAGIMQQVALTAAVLHDPEIVFLDEPTAGVTPAYRARFWELIRQIAKEGKTVFVTSHYMDEAEQCGRIALMRGGEIIALDSPAALKENTFKNPLFEVTPPRVASSGWLETLRKKDFVAGFDVYGLRYHLEIKNTEMWEKYLKKELPSFESRRIKPSLEDVFVRLVEGDAR